ncbi:MAG: FAD-dependent oxidoreductase, partial [Ruthenibacterium sp.]
KGLFHQNTYHDGDYYEIPYRSMVCGSIENLVVAGRCISTTFLMQASVRIIPTCLDMGQAAGEACAWAKRHAVALNAIDGAMLRAPMPLVRGGESTAQ